MFCFRDEKIQSKISRIIKIWEERFVYDDSYLADLRGLLTSPIQKLKLADPVQEFQVIYYYIILKISRVYIIYLYPSFHISTYIYNNINT